MSATQQGHSTERVYYDTPYGRKPPPAPVVEAPPTAEEEKGDNKVYYDTPYGRKPQAANKPAAPTAAAKATSEDKCCEETKQVNHNYCSNLR